MKYLDEYRNRKAVEDYLAEIHRITTGDWTIMEICGGQTHSLVRNGILDVLPAGVTMVHGPGCPVCVTPVDMIDKAVDLALNKGVTICSYGDMLRVPGSSMSLLKAKAKGADVRILYSPLEAVKLAEDNPDNDFVFFAVGFETTAPANALSVLHAQQKGLSNYSMLVSHVLVPPAMEAILSDRENKIQAFLGAGHVCAIMGYEDYFPIVNKYKVPVVVTGFEPVDLLQGILMAVRQLEDGRHALENQYARIVRREGNPSARKVIADVFQVSDRTWRGIGPIPQSGYSIRPELAAYDAAIKYHLDGAEVKESSECIAGQILRGLKKPHQCPQFGRKCSPANPLGAPMVSSEGACAAYYHYAQFNQPVAS